MQWFIISPKGYYVLKYDGVIVGYFSMQAMRKDAIERIFEQKGGLTKTEDMLPIVPCEPLECYISAIAVTVAGVSRTQSRIYGMLLLMGVFDRIVDLGREGIDIRRIWAKLGFVLDVEQSDLPVFQRYREAL